MFIMGTKQTQQFLREQQHSNSSALLDEVKDKLQLLRDSGLSVKGIVSLLHVEKPLIQLFVSKDYSVSLGAEHKPIYMEPIVKAVYLLFLKHPEGIMFKYLSDYREELITLYSCLRSNGITERARLSIEDVTNPLSNSINEKCSRIKAVFMREVDESIVEQYIITGGRGKTKKIMLPRELVVWE